MSMTKDKRQYTAEIAAPIAWLKLRELEIPLSDIAKLWTDIAKEELMRLADDNLEVEYWFEIWRLVLWLCTRVEIYPCDLLVLPPSYSPPVYLLDSLAAPDGPAAGPWLIPIDWFRDYYDLREAVRYNGRGETGWWVKYTYFSFKHHVKGTWCGYRSREAAFTLDYDTALQIKEWCCRAD